MKHKSHAPRANHNFNVPTEVMGVPIEVDAGSHLIADARGIWPSKKIVVGATYFALTEGEKRAVLHHEAAHCLKFHLEKRLLALPLLFLRPGIATSIAVNQELEADAFAAECGLGVELLSFLTRMVGKDGQFYPARAERMAALRKFILGERK